jgi:uncharacterized protein (TIGR02001 family)
MSVLAAAAMFASPALAADMPVKARPAPPPAPPSPWDIAFGAWLMSDYNFRGVSQSNRGPSVTAYTETRYNVNSNFQLYAGSQSWAVTLATAPTAEVDFFAGIRPTVGPFAFDFGFIYYYYPKEKQLFIDATGTLLSTSPVGATGVWTLANTDFWEVYGKVGWEAIKDRLAFGANVFYSPSWLKSGAEGLYASGTAKVTLPSFKVGAGVIDEVGWYLSGELGYYWIGTTTAFPVGTNFNVPDYLTWNAGIAFTWKVFTLDLRYYDTDLTQATCVGVGGDPAGFYTGISKWCNAAFIGTLKFDMTLANLK